MSNSYSMMLILNVFLFGLVYLVGGPWINFHLFEIDISPSSFKFVFNITKYCTC